MTPNQRARHKYGNAVRFAFRLGMVVRTSAGLGIAPAANQAQRGVIPRLLRWRLRLAMPRRAWGRLGHPR
jgi:hypothetical protein